STSRPSTCPPAGRRPGPSSPNCWKRPPPTSDARGHMRERAEGLSYPDLVLRRMGFGPAITFVTLVGLATSAVWAFAGPHPLRPHHSAEFSASPAAGQGSVGRGVGSVNGPRAQSAIAENARPATAAWRIVNGAKPHDIEGFADSVSAVRGERVALYVSTVAPTFHVEAYRMGYYQGHGGRLVWRSSEVPGQRQPKPTKTSDTNMIEAPWKPSTLASIDQ